ncbi:MAG TPA: Rieske 2Fe-2S domain-containing protein [Candidatus Binatia bacterium]|nr:Rieske 2Fe-2S domain-containing protein [Candidatus Binatia bacterium]
MTTSRYPMPPYPNGWYQVAYSDELEVGAPEPLHYFGKELVIYRGEDGQARVFDAFCPHLGAHLGFGGKVEGNDIRCPFHGWRYGSDGKCNEVPYGKRIPPSARLKAWEVIEKNGLIMVWHHGGGKAADWQIPDVPEYGSEEWTPYVKRRWKIRAHNQEMAENSVDIAHFRYVHGTLTVPESTATTEGPCLHVNSKMKMATPIGEVEGGIESLSWGFGFGCVRFRGIVDTLLVTSVTPIDGEHVDVRFSFSVKKIGDAGTTRGVGKALIADIDKQMSEDIPIWENKVFLDRPMLCDGDGPIGVFRGWCKQFYGEAVA